VTIPADPYDEDRYLDLNALWKRNLAVFACAKALLDKKEGGEL